MGEMVKRRIWKFQLQREGDQIVEMPAVSKILSIQSQHGPLASSIETLTGSILMWCLVDPETTTIKRRIRMFGTGHPVDTDGVYIGTVQDGPLVWHFFDAGDYERQGEDETA